MKFTPAEMFNKAKGVKLPTLPYPNVRALANGKKLSHVEYYKHMKEKYQ